MLLKEHKPKAIVVTLNLRSFDAAWIHSKLETPLQESMVLAQPNPNLINRFLLSLQAFDNKNEKQRETEMLYEWENTQLMFPFPFKYKTTPFGCFALNLIPLITTPSEIFSLYSSNI